MASQHPHSTFLLFPRLLGHQKPHRCWWNQTLCLNHSDNRHDSTMKDVMTMREQPGLVSPWYISSEFLFFIDFFFKEQGNSNSFGPSEDVISGRRSTATEPTRVKRCTVSACSVSRVKQSSVDAAYQGIFASVLWHCASTEARVKIKKQESGRCRCFNNDGHRVKRTNDEKWHENKCDVFYCCVHTGNQRTQSTPMRHHWVKIFSNIKNIWRQS